MINNREKDQITMSEKLKPVNVSHFASWMTEIINHWLSSTNGFWLNTNEEKFNYTGALYQKKNN